MVNYIDGQVRCPAAPAIFIDVSPHRPLQIGRVVAALQEKGMWNDTLLVCSSDNGGPWLAMANNWPLKGSKFSNWEGGIRTNAFVSGGFVPAAVRGTTSHELIALWDWCDFCVCALPAPPPLNCPLLPVLPPPVVDVCMLSTQVGDVCDFGRAERHG